MSFAIITDSTCDLTPDQLAELDIRFAPLTVHFGEDAYLDNVTMTPEEFYDRMIADFDKGLPKTAAPSPADFKKALDQAIQDGASGVLFVLISSGVSGTYNSACIAAEGASIPVRLIDSKSATGAMALMLRCALMRREAGASLDEVADELEEMVTETKLLLGLDVIDNLVKGGRADKKTARLAALLKIKPLIELNEEGVVENVGKGKGAKGLVNAIVKEIEAETEKHGELEIRFAHARGAERIDAVKAALREKGIAFDDTREPTPLGPVIATHIGIGSVAIATTPKRHLQ